MNRKQFLTTLVLSVFASFLGGALVLLVAGYPAEAQTNDVLTTHELRIVDNSGNMMARFALERVMPQGNYEELPYLEFYRDGKLIGGMTMRLDGGLYTLTQNPSNKLQLFVKEDRAPDGTDTVEH